MALLKLTMSMSLNKFLIPKFTPISLPLFFICKWHQHLQLFKPPNWKLYLCPSFSTVYTSNLSANFLYPAFELHLKPPSFSPSPLPPPWSAALWVTAPVSMSVPLLDFPLFPPFLTADKISMLALKETGCFLALKH